jgi:hypothetical protein
MKDGHLVCGPVKDPTPSPSPEPTLTNKPVVDTRPSPATNKGSSAPKPLPVHPVTPSANAPQTKVAALPPTPVKPTANAPTAGKPPAALPPAPIRPSANAPATDKKPGPLPVATVTPAPPSQPLPPTKTNASPPPVQPACSGEGAIFHPDQSESVTIHRTIVGGAPCVHKLEDRGTMFTGASVAVTPSHGSLTQTGEYEFKYQPAAGFKGSDRYALEVCGESNAGSGCSVLTYQVTVE